MKCPVCRTEVLHTSKLEGGLPVSTCFQCGGNWLSSTNYQRWLEDRSGPAPSISSERPLPVEDTSKAKLCPECGHILIRYMVSHDIDFNLDHCGNCHGVWFDQNEWEVLLRHNLHGNLHKVFNEQWQRNLMRDTLHKRQANQYRKKLGDEDFSKLQRIKKWLDEHPRRDLLLAYLNKEWNEVSEEESKPGPTV